ncbi:hypothetical protein [Actinoallomurus acanthiterrae]
MPRGPLGDLKALLYELYLEAGAPSLDEIVAWVAADDRLPGAPGRDTINRIIGGAEVPPSQADVLAVVTVLARAARWDRGDAMGRARELWVAARMDSAVGVPLAQVSDPFALEVHRPISLREEEGFPVLPVYVRRRHDGRLAQLVAQTAGGASAMAVLVAGSSAGKTRACWEALEPLREAGGWRLWHPFDPTRPEAALEALGRVGPRTVVWLNETQEYLGARGDGGERVAARLRSLLSDPARAPVLVLGTLWPEHHAALTQRPGSQVRLVLEGTVIEVPEAFTGTDLAALKQAAMMDPRLALAVERADDGQITQYLAGGPELLERFHAAPPAAKALILAAMDARRMGHRNALPHALLAEAVPAYLTDAQWDRLGADWLEQALAHTCQPCKGAQGPVTRIRPRTGRRTTPAGTSDDAPVYRLADYLDRYGRAYRADQIPPIGFWAAVAAHADPTDLNALGRAAYDRGLYRDAVQLHKHATACGDPRAAGSLIACTHYPDLATRPAARWAVAHAALDAPEAVATLLNWLREDEAYAERAALLARDPAAHVVLNDPGAVAGLLHSLRDVGAYDQAAVLLARDPAAHAVLDDPTDVALLLEKLREAGADDQVAVLLAHDPAARVALDHSYGVVDYSYGIICLLEALHAVGADDQAAALAERVAAQVSVDNPEAVASLLDKLGELGADDEAAALAERSIAHVAVDTPEAVARLLNALHRNDQVAMLLARDPAAHVALDDADAVGALLFGLHVKRAKTQLTVLTERIAEVAVDNNAGAVSGLLDGLRAVGAEDQVAVLLARDPAAHVPLNDAQSIAALLHRLHALGADDQVTALLARGPAAHVPLNDAQSIAALLHRLHALGADDQVTALLTRGPAAHVPLNDAQSIAALLHRLHALGADDQVTALLARDPAAHVTLDDSYGIVRLLGALRAVGADDEAAALAERLPAAGLFHQFMEIGDHKERFRFGREPDGTAAAPWAWEDLE